MSLTSIPSAATQPEVLGSPSTSRVRTSTAPRRNAAAEGSYSTSSIKRGALKTAHQSSLLNHLKQVEQDVMSQGFAKFDDARRTVWLCVQLELNARRKIAPAFRPGYLPYRPADPADIAVWQTHGRDRQFIDLDWMARRSLSIRAHDPRYARLFSAAGLDIPLAEQFVCESWTACKKAEMLGLPEFVQIELTTIRSTAIKERSRYATSKVMREDRARLNELAHDGRLAYTEIDLYSDLDLAGRLAKCGSHARVAELLGLIRGETPLSPSEVKARIRKLDRWLKVQKPRRALT